MSHQGCRFFFPQKESLIDPEVFKYTIPGCRLGQSSSSSVTMSLAVQSLIFNLTDCAAGDLTACNATCTDVASGQAAVECAEDGGIFGFTGCYANCAALPAYSPATNKGVVGAAEVSCTQGSYVLHGSTCTPLCDQETCLIILHGVNQSHEIICQYSTFLKHLKNIFTLWTSANIYVIKNVFLSRFDMFLFIFLDEDRISDVTGLICNDSAFVPSTFTCSAACAPPDGGPLVPWCVACGAIKNLTEWWSRPMGSYELICNLQLSRVLDDQIISDHIRSYQIHVSTCLQLKATIPPCEELDLQQVLRVCHARCQAGRVFLGPVGTSQNHCGHGFLLYGMMTHPDTVSLRHGFLSRQR